MLAALIAAVREAEDGSGLAATLPVAGRSLVERQARLAVSAGAAHVVVLVERLPAALTAAIDRLRRDGIAVEVARSAGDGADRFHPDERVLVFADGALATPASIARIAALPAPVLLTLGEGGPPGAWERIDAATRWSGVAMVSGELLRKTVAMLGDWDLHSTLLRRAVGASARRLDVADGADVGEAQPVMLVRSRAGARAATQASLASTTGGFGWPARLIYDPLARLALPAILDRALRGRWLRWLSVACAVAAVPAGWRGWLAAGIALLVAGALLDALGLLLVAVRLVPVPPVDRPGQARAIAAGAAALAFAAHRLDLGWLPVALAVVTVAALAASARERQLLGRVAALPPPPAAADPDALVLLFAIAAAAGQSAAGLLATALYAAGSFAAVQDRLARATAVRRGDAPLADPGEPPRT